MLLTLSLAVVTTIAYLSLWSAEVAEKKTIEREEEFEKEFYAAAWEINPFNNDWIEEALKRLKEDYDSYYHNPKALAFLEMMQEQDRRTVAIVNHLSKYQAV